MHGETNLENLGKMFGPVNESGVWEDPYRPDIISEIRKGKLRWLGHAEGIPEKGCLKNVFILT